MGFLEGFFRNEDLVENDSGWSAVCCPFPHSSPFSDEVYYEENASAHIHIDDGMFNCKVCGTTHSEASFIKEVLNISYKDALKVKTIFENKQKDNWFSKIEDYRNNGEMQELTESLMFSDEVMKELKVGVTHDLLAFPVFLFGVLVDVRNYNPDAKPKWKSRFGATSGLVVPDVSTMYEDEILWCAGEKDMAIARSMGFDAYCNTGGENKVPTLFLSLFKGKKVYIAYDNDQAGIDGAFKLAGKLRDAGATPYVVTGHHKVCKGKGEDVHDYFAKYMKTARDFRKILDETPVLTDEAYRKARNQEYPLVPLGLAHKSHFRNKYIESVVQVTAVYNTPFGIPNVIGFEKFAYKDGDIYDEGWRGEWILEDDNMQDILYLCDSNLKDHQVDGNIFRIGKIPKSDSKGMRMHKKSNATVQKVTVTQFGNEDSTQLSEYTMYLVDEKLENGKKYSITYKPVQHPLQQQEIVLIAKEVVEVDSDVDGFKINEEVKEHLDIFRVGEDETLVEKIEALMEDSKNLTKEYAPFDISLTSNLFYHTPLEFNLEHRLVRGYLDIMLIGEQRTGKSKTAGGLQKAYGLGSTINLGTATVAGVIGGTDKGKNKTKIGALPREHKGAIVFEEFSSMSDKTFLRSLTDIRTSNQIRIIRVDSEVSVPCKVRMLTISNPKADSRGNSKTLWEYANGIEVIKELVGTNEDIARYDFFCLIPATERVRFRPKESLPKEAYQTRIRWVWSRTKDQIIIGSDEYEYLLDSVDELNDLYDCSIKFFGTEAELKLSRIAVALAGLTCSTDSSYENIIVSKEHIKYAKEFMIKLYDNDLFKLKEFVNEQRSYNDTNAEVVAEVQDLWESNNGVLTHLQSLSTHNRNAIKDVSGMGTDDFAKFINKMTRLKLIKINGSVISPTLRFRKSMRKIDKTKNANVRKLGEDVLT